ncbi:MAG: YhcH/YjgK/YiaL family protein [Rickettsiales bacterium]|jgi:YhcH/YjgK/YiaL family protein|nr:YhcH/YjgK/YiaL family protein [Rickettsiales bacterium]
MIFDKLENFSFYASLNPRFNAALRWINSADIKKLPPNAGKITIDGDNVFAFVNEYNTKLPSEELFFEGHLKYIDIQLMIAGRETMKMTCKDGHEKTTIPYDAAKEKYFAAAQKSVSISIKEGEFVIFFPQDLHKCDMRFAIESELVRKIVFKAAVK